VEEWWNEIRVVKGDGWKKEKKNHERVKSMIIHEAIHEG